MRLRKDKISHIRIKWIPGITFSEAFAIAKRIADEYKSVVKFNFNGIMVKVDQNSNEEDTLREFNMKFLTMGMSDNKGVNKNG